MPLPTPLEQASRASARGDALREGAPRPHVCFLAPTTWPVLARDTAIPVVGGAEVQQSMIAPALVHRGYRVSMICYDYGQPVFMNAGDSHTVITTMEAASDQLAARLGEPTTKPVPSMPGPLPYAPEKAP